MDTGCMPDAIQIAKMILMYKSKDADQFKTIDLYHYSFLFKKDRFFLYTRLYNVMQSQLYS